MANEAVLKYLVDTNRPYSCADVTVNLRGAFGKTAIQKALDSMSESGKIKCKLYGKQKVYAAIQTESIEDEEDIVDYDGQVKTLTASIEENSSLLKTAEAALKQLTAAPTTDAAKCQSKQCEERIQLLETKLETLRNSTAVLSVEEKKCIMDEHDKLLREYRRRKRITNDMLEAVLEGYPKPKKALLDELCVETDEMVNFKLMSN